MNTPQCSGDQGQIDSLLLNAMPGRHMILLPNAPTFTVTAVTDDFLENLGIQREQLVGYSVFERFFQDKRNNSVATQLRHSLLQVIRSKQTHLMTDQTHLWPNSQTGVLELRTWRPLNKPVINSQGEVMYIIHTVEDVSSEVKLVEVDKANRYLQTIINLLKEPLQVLQPIFDQGEIIDFRFKFTNQAYAAYANATPEQLQDKRVGEVFPGYFETVSFTKPVETYQTGQSLTFEIHYDKDGLDLYNLMSTFKLDDEVVIHFTDFTRLRHLQIQLESKIDELNRSNDNLEQFASIASHDLQEPLRKIQSFSSLLASQLDGQLTELNRNYLQRINTATDRMATLIKDLLAYSRVSKNQQDFEPVALEAILADVLTTLDWSISQSNAQLDIQALPIVNGNALQLGQLFQNLLSNGIKFHRPEVPPRIRVTAEEITTSDLPTTIRPSRPATSYYRIDVIDNGIGFDEKYLDRIFQVFQRLHGRSEFTGTGIGLAICERVAANHGGAITARSRPGQGATFSVYLPS